MKQVRYSDPKENFFTVDLTAGRNGRARVTVPETGLEPVLPCGKRILSTLGKGGASIFV
jgi:hypothetical protein